MWQVMESAVKGFWLMSRVNLSSHSRIVWPQLPVHKLALNVGGNTFLQADRVSPQNISDNSWIHLLFWSCTSNWMQQKEGPLQMLTVQNGVKMQVHHFLCMIYHKSFNFFWTSGCCWFVFVFFFLSSRRKLVNLQSNCKKWKG